MLLKVPSRSSNRCRSVVYVTRFPIQSGCLDFLPARFRAINQLGKLSQFLEVAASSNHGEVIMTSLLHPIGKLRFVCGGKQRLAMMEADDVIAFTVDHEHRATDFTNFREIGKLVERQ